MTRLPPKVWEKGGTQLLPRGRRAALRARRVRWQAEGMRAHLEARGAAKKERAEGSEGAQELGRAALCPALANESASAQEEENSKALSSTLL